MRRSSVVALVVVLLLAFSSNARAQVCACPAPCRCEPPEDDEDTNDLKRVLATALAIFATSYTAATIYAFTLPHSSVTVDGLPVIGAIASAARDSGQGRDSGLLLFSALAQASAILVATTSAIEIHRVRAMRGVCVGAVATPSGGGVSLSLSLP
jgi:hypothetical protein